MEKAILIGILILTVGYFVRHLLRAFSGKASCGSCDQCSGCSACNEKNCFADRKPKPKE